MNRFEKITQDIDSLADFLSLDHKGDNKGCSECGFYNECNGKETCKNGWINSLSKEVE